MAIVMVSTLFPLSGCGGSTSAIQPSQDAAQSTVEYMTRGEWITLLGRTFGLDESQGQAAYYTDVAQDSGCFVYVQSCREWGVLPEDSVFRPDETADRAFVAETAVLAAELDCSASGGSTQAEKALSYAAAQGIVAGTDGAAKVTAAEGRSAADTAQKLYLGKDFEEYENIRMSDGVTDLTGLAAGGISVTDTTVVMPADQAAGLTAGSVFVIPGDVSNPGGIAKKVVSISYEGGSAVIETEEPQFEEVFDELSFASVGTPITDGITTADGVTMGGVVTTAADGQGAHIVRLGSDGQATSGHQGLSCKFKVNFIKGKIALTPGVGDLNMEWEHVLHMSPTEELGQWFSKTNYIYDKAPSVDDFPENGDGWEERLRAENKFKGGYEITGTIDLSNLFVKAEMEYKKILGIPSGINRLSIETNYDVSADLSYKGKLTEELTIATLPFVMPGGVVTAQLNFILYADASGELHIKAEVSNNTKTVYQNGATRKTSDQDSSMTGEFAVDLQFGPAIKVTLKAFNIKIVDVKLKTGVQVSASASAVGSVETVKDGGAVTKTYKVAIKASADLYLPIITLSVGTDESTLANRLKITFSWNISTKSNCAVQKNLYEHYWLFWEYTEELKSDDAGAVAGGNGETPGPNAAESSNPFASLVLQDALLTLGPGESKQIVITAYPDNVTSADIRYESLDTSVATVDGSGKVTGVAPGTTRIRVSYPGGSDQFCAVTVTGSGDTVGSHSFL